MEEDTIDLPPPLEAHDHVLDLSTDDLPPPPPEDAGAPAASAQTEGENSPRSARKGPPTAKRPPATQPKTATTAKPVAKATPAVSSPMVSKKDKGSKEKSAFEDDLRGKMKDSGEDLDSARKRNMAYEYLCHLEEARKWMEACLECELPPASELESALQNGVLVARLALFFAPEVVKAHNVYDIDEKVFKERGLVFRHTDNINQWLKAMRNFKFPEIFFPEVTDLYNRKNMPRVIYCVHALSRFLFHKGIAPMMEDLHGVVQFTEEELNAMEAELQKLGVQMPKFGKIGGILAAEMGVDEAAMHAAILAINQALDREEAADVVLGLLKSPHALLVGVQDASKELYRDDLISAKMEKVMNSPNGAPIEGEEIDPDKAIDIYETNLTKDEIQKHLNVINARIAAEKKASTVHELLAQLNEAIKIGSSARILEILQNDALELEGVSPDNAQHYLNALRKAKAAVPDSGTLSQAQVQDAVDTGNQAADALGQLQAALEAGDLAAFLDVLQRNEDVFGAVDANAAQRYFDAFAAARRKGEKLTLDRAKELVAQVNAELEAVRAVNEAIQRDDPDSSMAALQHKALALEDVDEAGAFQYHFVLSEHRKKLGVDLTRDVIQSDIYAANKEAEENALHAAVLFELNDTARKGNADATLRCLHKPQARVNNIQDKCARRYQDALQQGIRDKETKAGSSFLWLQFATDDGRTYYHNKKTKDTQWVPPTDVEDHNLLIAEIQDLVNKCNTDQARWEKFEAIEPKIVELQACIRGMLVRKAFRDRLSVLNGNEAAVVKIQSAFRGQQQRKKYKDRLDFLNGQVAAAVKLQAAWKGKKARDQYKNLTAVKNPPAATVRQFLHLLDQSDSDFSEELKLQQLKQKVVLAIKNCHQLDQDLNEMDIKIGLLVKNRIELQDVVKQSKKLKKQRKEGGSNPALMANSAQNLKSLTKSSRERLESYQHLFYLIQTHPTYLAKLVFIEKPLERWSEHKTSTFLQQVIQLVYNYASNSREQYLLHKLYREALQTEVKTRVDAVRDFVTGNPTVIKLVVNHHRGGYIRDTLAPLVKSVLSRDDLDLNAEAIDVYKRWISRQEAETGVKSQLPFEVDAATAYSHEPVRQKVQEVVAELLSITAKFRDGIISSLSKMPYGLRYICNAVHHDLRAKFPDATEDDILKVISNIIYYRFMNPAVIAPEAFDVVTVEGMANQITPVQRQNLANVAKLLQFAAAAQTYNDDHMSDINKFLVESWGKFRAFFLSVISVESLEEHFSIDEYTDARMVSKPQITISPAEIFYLHEMLAVNIEDVAPDAKDQLREILADLGPVGDETVVLGEEGSQELAASKTPITVNLTNKFEVPEADDSSIRALFVRTKRMVVDVIRFQQGKSLKAILTSPATDDMEKMHKEHITKRKAEAEAKRKAEGAQAGDEEGAQAAAVPEEEFVTLEDTKKKVLANAKLLEASGLCKEESGYQELLNAVAQDIRNQRVYRRERKAELTKLTSTISELAAKKKFQSEQIDCYDHYVQACVEQMGKGKAKPRVTLRGMVSTAFSRHDLQKSEDGGQNFGVVRYTAAKLQERGVLVSVDGIDDSKLKNVQLEIASQETGVFQVAVKAGIMGLSKEMEKTEIVFQDLLQLQYEGKQTMKMFDVCVVNVNLLIFLINKKFYGK